MKRHKAFSFIITVAAFVGAVFFVVSHKNFFVPAKQNNNAALAENQFKQIDLSSPPEPPGPPQIATTSPPDLIQKVLSDTINRVQADQQALPSPEASTPDPVVLKVVSIKLVAPIVKTGLEANGSLHVPSSPDQTGWFDLGPKPGDIGPSVITGHLDSKAGPGVLYNLKKIKIGAEINVVRNDGSTAVFTVDRLDWYPQNNFNTQAVYGPISTAGLRIITCAGTFNKATQSYSDDLVVYATLKQIVQPQGFQPR